MAGGYSHDPSGIDGINRRLRQVERALSEIRGAAGTNSAVIKGRLIEFRNEDGDTIVEIGQTSGNTIGLDVVDLNADRIFSAMHFFDDERSSVVVGDPTGTVDWFLVQGTDTASFYVDWFQIGSAGFPVPNVEINSTRVGLFDLPTTSNAANVHLGTVGGFWTLARVTSSRRYKTDIGQADIDPNEVLTLDPRTWVDKTDAEAAGDMVPKDASSPAPDGSDEILVPYVPPRQIGFIAEDAWERKTLQQFVGLDAEGEPDSFDYERFASVGLHAVCKAQQEQIDSQAAEIDDLKATVAAMAQRLDAMEART